MNNFAEQVHQMSIEQLRSYKSAATHLGFLSNTTGVCVLLVTFFYMNILTIFGCCIIIPILAKFSNNVTNMKKLVLNRLYELEG